MTEYQSERCMDSWLTVHAALVDNSSGSRTVSRPISKRAASRPMSSNPWHETVVNGELPAAVPSPNLKTAEYAAWRTSDSGASSDQTRVWRLHHFHKDSLVVMSVAGSVLRGSDWFHIRGRIDDEIRRIDAQSIIIIMSLTEEYTLNDFVFQIWWPLDFVGYHHTRSETDQNTAG